MSYVKGRSLYKGGGGTELHSLVREGTPVVLALGAWEYLSELGHYLQLVSEGYNLLVTLLAHHRQA